MSDLLASMKADLTSRRMLPLLVLAAIALLGAIGYVALGAKSGNASSPANASTGSSHVAAVPGPAVSTAPANPNAAVSETTVGAKYQHGGKMRDPFTPLKGKSSSAQSSSSSSGGGSSGGSSPGSAGSSGSSSSGSSAPTGGSQPSASGGGSSAPSSSSVSLYHVDVALQQLSEEGQPVGEVQTFQNVTALQPLPSKHKALVEPTDVTGGGAGVAFELMREEIIHGDAKCIPSAADCQAIDLKLHASEEIQYQQEDGTVLAYRLTVTKIQKVSASAASAASVHSSAAGSALIARLHLTVPSRAAFDGQLGTIVGGPAVAGAHAARRSRHSAK